MKFPPCFESNNEYELWIELAEQSGVKAPANKFCMDCTSQYKSWAMSKNLCSQPETIFISVTNEDGEDETIGATLDMVVE